MRWCSLGKRARLGASRVNQPSPPKKKTSKLGGMILECDGQHGWHSKQRDTKSSLSFFPRKKQRMTPLCPFV